VILINLSSSIEEQYMSSPHLGDRLPLLLLLLFLAVLDRCLISSAIEFGC
jgi:hypothetical protein